jgi:hypothetical protein
MFIGHNRQGMALSRFQDKAHNIYDVKLNTRLIISVLNYGWFFTLSELSDFRGR